MRSIIFPMTLLTEPGSVAGTHSPPLPGCSPALHFRLPTIPSARVLHQIRTLKAPTRSLIRDTLEISQPTVTRHVRALIDAGLVEERQTEHDGERAGRPHAVLGLDGRHVIVWGMHIGVRSTHLTITDGAGRLIREMELPILLPERTPAQMVALLVREMEKLACGLPTPVSVGAAVSAHLDRRGIVNSREYGWTGVDLANRLSRRLGRAVHVGAGVAAMAAQELLSRPISPADSGSTLYFYAREVVNHAWIVNGTVHRPHSGRLGSSFRELAQGSVLAQGEDHPFSGAAAVSAARRAGIQVDSFRDLVTLGPTNATARKITDARARLLGDAITLILDAVDPSALVLAGEAFTADHRGLEHSVTDIRAQRGGPSQLKIHLAGPAVTRDAARLVGVFPLWTDPLAQLVQR